MTMQTGSGAKNPPWARSSVNSNITGMNPQIMDPNAMMSQQGMMPFQQTQAVFNPNMMQAQGGMAMPMGGQMPMNQIAQGQMYPGNVVAYPTPRGLNPGMYQNAQNNQSPSNTEQRVFTGTVTKTHNDFGFVDHDVFYQTSVCAKGIIPKVNDRVLVEATFNPNMPFKWNATRVQVLPKGGQHQKSNAPKSNTYNAVPPPSNAKKQNLPNRRDDRRDNIPRREERPIQKRSRSRSGSRSRDRRDSRTRRDSPPRKRPVIHQPSPAPKYVVRVPRMPLDIQKMDVPALSQRYTSLYIPSDFFNAQVKWGETFPPQMPFSLNNPCNFHIMSKECENPIPNDAVLEPPDSDYRFSAKVMLISMPTLETLYQKCGLTKSDDKEKRSSKNPLHPTRLIKFLVGQRGKGGENFAIGGPWSPSLDGENPQSDPSVLVRTAIRTCKALTGIDLSSCTQWYRVVEFYYWREQSGGGRSRLECVVLYLPDVWAAQAPQTHYRTLTERYSAAADARAQQLDAPAHSQDLSIDVSSDANDSTATITIDENDDDEEKPEPTHYSKIDLKTMKVEQLRQELRARNVSCKGLRGQLVSRLSKLVKAEEEKDQKSDDVMELEDDDTEKEQEKKEEPKKEKEADKIEADEKKEVVEDDKKDKKEKSEKDIEEEKKKIEKEKQQIKTRYEVPSDPHIIVHPNASAKGGKFTCSVATLSLLLDYRITDNKEHSFELFVFAELFNEMLMRDFGFYIYKTLYTLPEKAEEVKEVKEKEKSAEKTDKKEEKKEEKKEDKDKKEDKRDDKDKDRRDSRRRDRRESHSDDERSGSPRRRSRGVELPADPYLLLALVYFDTTRVSYINKKDLQNLFMSLGLQLSRSQIRCILEKVCVKDAFSYKSLLQSIKDLSAGAGDALQDLPLDSVATNVTPTEVPPHIAELEASIAAGNRELLPVFNRPTDGEDSSRPAGTMDISETGIVTYKSRVIDVGALVAAMSRESSSRAKLESQLEACRRALEAARAAAASTARAQQGAQHQLSDVSTSLAAARARIASLTASSKIFHSALKSIQSKVEAVVNIKYEDDDVVEVVNGPTKLEKEPKKEKKEDDKSDVKEVIDIKEDTEKETETENKETVKESDIITTENMDLDDKE